MQSTRRCFTFPLSTEKSENHHTPKTREIFCQELYLLLFKIDSLFRCKNRNCKLRSCCVVVSHPTPTPIPPPARAYSQDHQPPIWPCLTSGEEGTSDHRPVFKHQDSSRGQDLIPPSAPTKQISWFCFGMFEVWIFCLFGGQTQCNEATEALSAPDQLHAQE